MQNRKSFLVSGLVGLALIASAALPAKAQAASLIPSKASGYGLVGISNTGSVRVINTADWSITAPLLTGEMGSFGGGLFDVAMTPDGKTALISNFGDSLVTILDMTNPIVPKVKGKVQIDFFAEDIDITPDGRYALVTDGGFSSKIFVIDILARHGRSYEFTAPFGNINTSSQAQMQSVSIMADGRTVLCADYWNGTVQVFLLDTEGTPTFSQTVPLPLQTNPHPYNPPADPYMPRPINIALSPDGVHAAVLAVGGSGDPIEDEFGAPTVFLCRRIAPGMIELVADNGWEGANKQPQSGVFSVDGKKLYVSASGSQLPAPVIKFAAALPNVTPTNSSYVRVFNVSGDTLSLAQDIPITPRGTSQLFGVDTIALDQSGQFVVVTNPTLSGAVTQIDVISTISNGVIRTIVLPDQTYLDSHGDPQTDPSIPVGVAFNRYPRYMRPGQ